MGRYRDVDVVPGSMTLGPITRSVLVPKRTPAVAGKGQVTAVKACSPGVMCAGQCALSWLLSIRRGTVGRPINSLEVSWIFHFQ